MWPGSSQYKQKLFTCGHCFSCFVSGLNQVLLICIRLSLGANTICLGCNMGVGNCFNNDDDSQHFSCQWSKSWLSQCIVCTIAWLKVMGLSMVNKRSFTSPWSPNWNWLMSITSSHELSHASYLNSKVYTKVGCDPWWRACNLFIVVHSLSKLPKKTPKFSRNASKSFKRGD